MAGIVTPYKSTWNKNNSILQPYNPNPNQLLIDANKKLGSEVYKIPTTTTKTSTTKNNSGGVVTDKKSTVTTQQPLKAYTSSGSGSSGSGGGAVASSYESTVKPYLDAMVAAYGQGADANRATALSTYNATINNLNDILKQAQQAYDITLRNAETALGQANDVYDIKIRDLEEVLKRAQGIYDTGAATAREDYKVTESNLKKALERFQAQNAKDAENQRKSYLTDQAALESARLEADRQTRIDAAARGLGGSGLQQLAQLQNLLNQGQDISDLATGNQEVLDKLRNQLIEAEEDTAADIKEAERVKENKLKTLLTTLQNTQSDVKSGKADALKELQYAQNTNKSALEDALQVLQNAQATNKTKLQDALAAYNASVQGIDANLANQVANAYYSYGQDKYSANQAAASARNSAAAQSAADDSINAMLAYLQDDLSSSLSSLNSASTKTLKELRKQYGLGTDATKTDIANAMTRATLNQGANTGLNTSQYNTFNNNLNAVLKNANIKNDKTLWEKLFGK